MNKNVQTRCGIICLLTLLLMVFTCGCGHRETYNLGTVVVPISSAEGEVELISTELPSLIGRPVADGYPLKIRLELENNENVKIPLEKRYYDVEFRRTSGSSPRLNDPFSWAFSSVFAIPLYSAQIAVHIVFLQWDDIPDIFDDIADDFVGEMPASSTPAQDMQAKVALRQKIIAAKAKDKLSFSTYLNDSRYSADANLVKKVESSRVDSRKAAISEGKKIQLRCGSKIFTGETNKKGIVSFELGSGRKAISDMRGMVLDVLAEHNGNMNSIAKVRLADETIESSLAQANKAYMEAVGTPALPPRGLVAVEADSTAIAGENCRLSVTVKNVGKGEFYRLVGVSSSADKAFDGIEFPFGRLDPGESFTIDKNILLPRGHDGGDVTFSIRWRELNDYYPDTASARVSVVSLDRPQFATRVQVIDDNTGSSVGNGDGRIQKGEAVDLLVTVKNVGTGQAKDVKVRLDGLGGIRGVLGNVTSASVGDIAPGAAAQCRLTVTAKKTAQITTLKARLKVTDSFIGISRSEALNLAIDQKLPVSIMVYRATRYVGESEIAIRGGAGGDSAVIATASPGVALQVTGELGDYLRVELKGVGSGWVEKNLVSVSPLNAPVVWEENASAGSGGVITVLENTGPVLVLASPANNLETKNERIKVSGMAVDDRNVSRLEVKLNGRIVTEPESVKAIGLSATVSQGDTANLTEVPFEFSLVLADGINEIEVTAWDDEGLSSSRLRKVSYMAATGEIFVVSIGIDDYPNVNPDLNYATEDARAVAECFRRNLGVPDENISLLLNEQATSSRIRRELADRMRSRAGEEDTVIIYFSGHGAPEADPASADNDGVEKYLLPYEADKKALYSTAIRMEEIRNFFRRINSQRVVFLVDSCYSGMAGGKTISSGSRFRSIDQQSLLKRLSQTGKGRVIITASGGSEVSQEKDSLGHGVFTYYLLKGLDGKADSNSNGEVTVDELFSYVSREVPRETNNTQHPLKALVEDVDGDMVISVPQRK